MSSMENIFFISYVDYYVTNTQLIKMKHKWFVFLTIKYVLNFTWGKNNVQKKRI